MLQKQKAAADPYTMILAALEDGSLAPGTRLRETDLAEQFNTSRTPIRNALHRLMSQGLVVQAASNGVALAKLQYLQVVELFQMRQRLEGAAARLATINKTPPLILALEKHLGETQVNGKSFHEMDGNDWKFHEIIHKGSDNEQLMRLMSSMRITSMLIPHVGMGAELHRHTTDDHQHIVECIIKGDPDGAYSAAKDHIARDLAARIPFLVHEDVELTPKE